MPVALVAPQISLLTIVAYGSQTWQQVVSQPCVSFAGGTTGLPNQLSRNEPQFCQEDEPMALTVVLCACRSIRSNVSTPASQLSFT